MQQGAESGRWNALLRVWINGSLWRLKLCYVFLNISHSRLSPLYLAQIRTVDRKASVVTAARWREWLADVGRTCGLFSLRWPRVPPGTTARQMSNIHLLLLTAILRNYFLCLSMNCCHFFFFFLVNFVVAAALAWVLSEQLWLAEAPERKQQRRPDRRGRKSRRTNKSHFW